MRLKTLSSLVLLCLIQLNLIAQETFECDGTMYFSYGSVNVNGTVYLGAYDTATASNNSTVASSVAFNFNALAYNYLDNYMYAVANPSRLFYKIDASGTFTSLGFVSGVSPNRNIYAADFDENGVFVLSGHVMDSSIYRVDMTGSSPVLLTTATRSYSNGAGIPDFGDIAFNRLDSTFYGLDDSTGIIHSIDPVSGVAIPISVNTAGPGALGALFFGPDFKYLYGHGRIAANTNDSIAYRCDLSTGICSMIASGQNSIGNGDGCACHTVDDASGIEPTKNTQIDVFPNPSPLGSFEIKSSSSPIQSFEVYSLDGKLIQSVDDIGSINAFSQIDVPGVYSIKIRTKDQLDTTVRLVITK